MVFVDTTRSCLRFVDRAPKSLNFMSHAEYAAGMYTRYRLIQKHAVSLLVTWSSMRVFRSPDEYAKITASNFLICIFKLLYSM